MNESDFQKNLIKEIHERLPGSIVMKNDSKHIQGIPDLTVLYEKHWAALECKKTSKSSKRPNQPYYVQKMNDMSFARVISPENKEDILNEMERSFGLER